MYGDSYGSPGQDDHFDPSSPLGSGHPLGQHPYATQQEPFESQGGDVHGGAPSPASFEAEPDPFDAAAGPFEPAPEFDSAVPATDVKVAGIRTSAWSRMEMDEADVYQPERSAHSGALKVAVAATAAVVVIGGGGAAALAMGGGSGSGEKAAAGPAPQASLQNAGPDVAQLQNQVDENARKVILDRASQAARADAGKAPALSAKGAAPTPTPSTSSNAPGASSPVTANAAQQIAVALMPSWNWDPKTQFNNCLKPMWARESGWNVTAANPSGAYGIPQALPGDKMATAGSDWRTSAATQIKWGFGYIKGRYGDPCHAWTAWQANGGSY